MMYTWTGGWSKDKGIPCEVYSVKCPKALAQVYADCINLTSAVDIPLHYLCPMYYDPMHY